jgi:hypothetical protein
MRIAALLPCLLLTACLATGEQPAPEASAVAAGPAGGASTSAAQATAAAPPADDSGRDLLAEARVDCWAKVEHEKGLRDINRRIAFVDKCIANAMKGKR